MIEAFFIQAPNLVCLKHPWVSNLATYERFWTSQVCLSNGTVDSVWEIFVQFLKELQSAMDFSKVIPLTSITS